MRGSGAPSPTTNSSKIIRAKLSSFKNVLHKIDLKCVLPRIFRIICLFELGQSLSPGDKYGSHGWHKSPTWAPRSLCRESWHEDSKETLRTTATSRASSPRYDVPTMHNNGTKARHSRYVQISRRLVFSIHFTCTWRWSC